MLINKLCFLFTGVHITSHFCEEKFAAWLANYSFSIKASLFFPHNQSVGAKNIYGTARGENETDYENAETIFRQRDSDNCDVDYVNMEGNVGKIALGNDFAGKQIYISCAGQYKELHHFNNQSTNN